MTKETGYTTKPIELPLSTEKEYVLVDKSLTIDDFICIDSISEITNPFKPSNIDDDGCMWLGDICLCVIEGEVSYRSFHEVIRNTDLKTETPEEKEALDSIASNSELPDGSEWDGWDDDGYACCIPQESGIEVLAFIDAKVNGTSGSRGRWVEAKTVCACYASNGGLQVIVECNGRNYAIGAMTYLRKPETPEQKSERERLESAYNVYCDLVKSFTNKSALPLSLEQFKDAHKKSLSAWIEIGNAGDGENA